jgi:hypothetical protein
MVPTTRSRETIDPAVAVSLPIAVAPFGYLFGSLFVTHLFSSETRAVWMATVALTSLTLLVYAVSARRE